MSRFLQSPAIADLSRHDKPYKKEREHPEMGMKYPWRTKGFYPLKWPVHGASSCRWAEAADLSSCPSISQRRAGPARSSGSGALNCMSAQRSKLLGQIGRLQSRCTKHSRLWKELQRAKHKVCRRAERRIRDLRHKATLQVIDWGRSSRADTPHCCLSESAAQPLLAEQVGSRDRSPADAA
jgi:hypothetical protein